MCEALYSWLLRLYPEHFLKEYSGDALQLFRDRLQDDSKRMQSEFARVQSEIDGYTRTNEAAWESLNAINQSLGQFKRAVGPSQSH